MRFEEKFPATPTEPKSIVPASTSRKSLSTPVSSLMESSTGSIMNDIEQAAAVTFARSPLENQTCLFEYKSSATITKGISQFSKSKPP